MGDSRTRNIFDYFEQMVWGNFTPWVEKPHCNIRSHFSDFNFKVDFLWGPQTETGNQLNFIMIFLNGSGSQASQDDIEKMIESDL